MLPKKMCQLIAAGIIRDWDGRTQQPGEVTRRESSKWAAKQGRRARRARTTTIGPVQSPKKLEWIANSMSATYPHAAPLSTWRGRWARNTDHQTRISPTGSAQSTNRSSYQFTASGGTLATRFQLFQSRILQPNIRLISAVT
jgi:hypothetical protein